MGTIFATVAFSIDAMLPALPEIAAELTPEDANRAQLILTSFRTGHGDRHAGGRADVGRAGPQARDPDGCRALPPRRGPRAHRALAGDDPAGPRHPGPRRRRPARGVAGHDPRPLRGPRHGADRVLRDADLHALPRRRPPDRGGDHRGLRLARDLRGVPDLLGGLGRLAHPAPARDAGPRGAPPAEGRPPLGRRPGGDGPSPDAAVDPDPDADLHGAFRCAQLDPAGLRHDLWSGRQLPTVVRAHRASGRALGAHQRRAGDAAWHAPDGAPRALALDRAALGTGACCSCRRPARAS
jgi:hypothetical protein